MSVRAASPTAPPAPLGIRRELLLIAAAVAFGLLIMPLLIWIAGHWTLGPYTHGDSGPGYGPVTLFGDYFAGLSRGFPGYWVAALGPVLLVYVIRLWFMLLRHFARH